VDRLDPMGADRSVNRGETSQPDCDDQAFFRRLAEVFLDRVPGAPEVAEVAVTDCLADSRDETGALRVLGIASVRNSECRLILESDLAYLPGSIDWLMNVTASMLPNIRKLHLRSILYELLSNAMEHGNLEIGYQEKQWALAQGRYEDVLRQRLADPRLNTRRITVHVRYEKDGESLNYRIADEGGGFPWQRYMQCYDKVGRLTGANGRGIFIVRSLCAELTYNEPGNEVVITITASSA